MEKTNPTKVNCDHMQKVSNTKDLPIMLTLYVDGQNGHLCPGALIQKQAPGVIRVFRMCRCPLFSLTCLIDVQKQAPGVIRVFRMSRCPLFSLPCCINIQKQSPGYSE